MAMNYGSKPVMSSVMPQVGGITIVDETTPNLEMIQSFPVVSRDGNVHIHQDPNTGQMYQMTTEFHSRIPQIVASQKMMMSRNGTIGNITFGVMPPTGRRTRGRNITINLSIEDVTLLKDRYGPNNDTADPTCAIMRAYFNDLNRNPNLDTPLYPCEGFPPGVTEQYVTVNYRISGQSNKTRIFRFFLDANGQCRCEIVSRIPGDFEDRGSGSTGTGTGMGNLGTLGNVTFGVTQPNRRRNRGRNLTIDLSIEDVTLLKDRYGPNNDTVDPTCAIMRAYFNELNRNPNLDTPIYPCEGFGPGVTEQYVTVNYRISGGRNRTRIFRFFLDADGQCRCEIVNRIPSDFEDTGSGPNTPSGGVGTLSGGSTNINTGPIIQTSTNTDTPIYYDSVIQNSVNGLNGMSMNNRNLTQTNTLPIASNPSTLTVTRPAVTQNRNTNNLTRTNRNTDTSVINSLATSIESNRLNLVRRDMSTAQNMSDRIIYRPIMNTFSTAMDMSMGRSTTQTPINNRLTFSLPVNMFGRIEPQNTQTSFTSQGSLMVPINSFSNTGNNQLFTINSVSTSRNYSRSPVNRFARIR